MCIACSHGKGESICTKVTGRHLIFIILVARFMFWLINPFTTMRGFTSYMVSTLTMISTINGYRKPLLNHVGSHKYTTHATSDWQWWYWNSGEPSMINYEQTTSGEDEMHSLISYIAI